MKNKILFFTFLFLFVPFFNFPVKAEETEITPTPRVNRQLNREIKKEEITAKKTEKFCTGLDTVLSKLTSNLEERLTKVETNKSTRLSNYENAKETRDENLLAKRSEWMVQREAHYAKLLEKFADDDQKTAIATYKQAVESAVKTRQNSVDNAHETYRMAVENLISSKEKLSSSAIDTYKTAVSKAISNANSSCSSSTVDLQTIKSNLELI